MLLGAVIRFRRSFTSLAVALQLLLPPFFLIAVKEARASEEAREMSPEAQASLQRALSAYDKGNLQEAEPLLRDLTRSYPDNFQAAEALGLIYAQRDNVSAALPLLERARSLRPSSAVANENLGVAYLKLNRPRDAVVVLEHAALLDPKNSQTQSSLGQGFMLLGRPREAAAAFAAATAGDPNNPDLRYNWALALLNAGDARQAKRVLEGQLENESSAQVQSLLGDIEEKLGNYQSAVEHLQSAAQLDPSEGNLFALGFEFTRHWTFPAAIKIYEYGTTKYPASARLKLGLGIAKYGNSDYAGAAPIFFDLLQSAPENILYADLLGHTCTRTANPQDLACGKLEDFAEHHPRNATAATFAAASILRRPLGEKNLTRAQALLQQAISANPKLADAYLQMGILYEQQKHWPEGAAMFEKALALNPKLAEAHYRLARAYSRLGKKEQAQREMALHEKYNQTQKDIMNARLQEVTTFLVSPQ